VSKHTPGPWFVQKGFGTIYALSGGTSGITTAIASPLPHQVDGGEAEALANARLIAAAPELLSALEEILNYVGGADSALDDEYVMERANAAIAKARGET